MDENEIFLETCSQPEAYLIGQISAECYMPQTPESAIGRIRLAMVAYLRDDIRRHGGDPEELLVFSRSVLAKIEPLI